MRSILRNFTAYEDGSNFHLVVKELVLPAIRDMTEEARGGGMDVPVDVALGLQKLAAEIKLEGRSRDLMLKAGLKPGMHKRVTFRGYSVDELDGAEHSELVIIEGRINANPDAWKHGGIVGVSYPVTSIIYFKHAVDGEVIHEIDAANMVRIVGGVDQNTGARDALGMGTS
ncbi:MAG: phage major tail tube protein [Pseudomonadota bacterium]